MILRNNAIFQGSKKNGPSTLGYQGRSQVSHYRMLYFICLVSSELLFSPNGNQAAQAQQGHRRRFGDQFDLDTLKIQNIRRAAGG